jgi:hypothetical protein
MEAVDCFHKKVPVYYLVWGAGGGGQHMPSLQKNKRIVNIPNYKANQRLATHAHKNDLNQHDLFLLLI